MYREAWLVQRESFYDPAMRGLDSVAAEKTCKPCLDGLSSLRDLSCHFAEMMGEVTAGHVGVDGGAASEVKRIQTGLLGGDYEVVNGRYRFRQIYNGEKWNPQMRAPLTQVPTLREVRGRISRHLGRGMRRLPS